MEKISEVLKDKKGSIEGIIVFIAIAAVLFLLAPFLFKMVNMPLQKFSTALTPIDSNAANAVEFGRTRFAGFFDYIILAVFFGNTLLLFFTAFMTGMKGSHPIFLIIFIIAMVAVVALSPNYLAAVDKVWTDSNFATEKAAMPGTSWLYQNFSFVLLGIIVICGILTYTSYRMSVGNQVSGGYR